MAALGAIGALALGGLAVPASANIADRCEQSRDCVPNAGGDRPHDRPDDRPGHDRPGHDRDPDDDGPRLPDDEPRYPDSDDSPSAELPPGMDSATETDECTPGNGCSVSTPAGQDSRFTISASGGRRSTVLFGTTNGNYASERLGSSGAGRPDCPNYSERNADWVQFGFLQPRRGATWSKRAVMTQRQTGSQSQMTELARELQICFASPYTFRTRQGFGLGRHGSHYAGVLPECGGGGPCVERREIFPVGGEWGVRIVFRVPANAKDPKALG